MHVITRKCSLECLEPLLSRMTFAALVEGIEGSQDTSVGRVIELYEQRKLMDIKNISTGRCGEIGRCLVRVGVIDAQKVGNGVRTLR